MKIEENSYARSNQQNFNELIRVILDLKTFNIFNKSKKHLRDWMESIIDPKLKRIDYSIATLVYWIANDLHDFPKCDNPSCNKPIECNVYSFDVGYKRFCCNKCANSSPQVLKLKEQRSIEKHGVPHFTNREKAEQTTLLHLGVRYPFLSKAIRDKSTLTFMQNYGVSSFMLTDSFKEKSLSTLLDDYGVDNIMKVPLKVIDAANTKEARYGNKNFNNRALYKKTMLDLYGYESNFLIPEFKKMLHDKKDEINDKKRKTLQKNFGLSHSPSFTYEHDGKYFDSAPEVAYYIWLKDNGIDFIYLPAISYHYFDGESDRQYCPDFIVEGKVVELKGDHFFEDRDPSKRMICPYDHSKDDKYEAKHQCMLNNGVLILTGKDYLKYLDYIKHKYGKGFIKNLKSKVKNK